MHALASCDNLAWFGTVRSPDHPLARREPEGENLRHCFMVTANLHEGVNMDTRQPRPAPPTCHNVNLPGMSLHIPGSTRRHRPLVPLRRSHCHALGFELTQHVVALGLGSPLHAFPLSTLDSSTYFHTKPQHRPSASAISAIPHEKTVFSS